MNNQIPKAYVILSLLDTLSLMYLFRDFFDFQRPCLEISLSLTPALAAADALPILKECVPNDRSGCKVEIGLKPSKLTSLTLLSESLDVPEMRGPADLLTILLKMKGSIPLLKFAIARYLLSMATGQVGLPEAAM